MVWLLFLALSLSFSFLIEYVPETGNPPDMRAYACMVMVRQTQCLYLFGGLNDFGSYFNDLWEFNLTQSMWSKVSPLSVERPEGRINFGMFLDEKAGLLYVFGGELKSGFTNDMWVTEPKLNSWTKVDQKGDVPPLIAFFSYNTFKDKDNKLKFIVHSGRNVAPVNDVYVYWLFRFDVEEQSWTMYPSNGDLPSPGASSTYFDGKQYSFSGSSIVSPEFKTSRFNFTTETWENVTTYNSPMSRDFAGIAVYNDYVYALPGWSNWIIESINDISRLPIKSANLTWEAIPLKETNEAVNLPRNTYALATDGSICYMAAGYAEDNTFLNDLISIDLSKNPIEAHLLSSSFQYPPLRSGHKIQVIGTKFYTFAGQGENSK